MEIVAQNEILRMIVEEFDEKIRNVNVNIANFKKSMDDMKSQTIIQGTYAENVVKDFYLSDLNVINNLNQSAWKCVIDRLKLVDVMPATEYAQLSKEIGSGLEFTAENFTILRPYLDDPRGSSLKAFAEVFSSLDKFYKSHDNFGVGKKGLPKRVIISGYTDIFGPKYRWSKILDTCNALCVYRGLPKLHYVEVKNDVESINFYHEYNVKDAGDKIFEDLGVSLKKFSNGNVHIHFDKKAQDDINRALHEFYGDVIPDGYERKPDKKSASTEVSKDLQFYGTPKTVAKSLVERLYGLDKDASILEPSCGEAAVLSELRMGGYTNLTGVEVDQSRFQISRSKGFKVYHTNFLEWNPMEKFDAVVMNPPFYGKHYEKHIRKALSLLSDGGSLISILPASARYTHKLLDELKPTWQDLPMGSFKESGTMINTCIVRIVKK